MFDNFLLNSDDDWEIESNPNRNRNATFIQNKHYHYTNFNDEHTDYLKNKYMIV